MRGLAGEDPAVIFDTKVHGIPCQCRVVAYKPSLPMLVYGPGFGDADPPEGDYFEYEVLDRRGREAPWLAQYVTEADEQRLKTEALQEQDY